MKKVICLLLLCFLPAAAFSQETVADSIRAIQKDGRLDAVAKVRKIHSALKNEESGADEKLDLYYNILIPEIKKIKQEDAYNEEMGDAYRYLSDLYFRNGDFAALKGTLDTAMVHIEKVRNDTIRAAFYKQYGAWHLYSESVETGHRYYYKAIDLFEKLCKKDEISSAFLEIANTHAQMRDYEALWKVVSRLREMNDENVSNTFLYHLYQITGAYYHLMYEAFPKTEAYRDSTVLYMKKSIYIVENFREQLSAKVDIAWSYYNLMVVYTNNFDPPLIDSAEHYLNKIKNLDLSYYTEENDRTELLISVYDMEAWLHHQRGEYAAAEKKMLEVLDLIEGQNDPNMVIPERSEAYDFLAMLYEETSRPAEALKYRKLLAENQAERFSQEKMYALKELNTKYEVEKKEAHIEELKKEKEYAHRIFLLTLFISAALLLVVVLLVAALRLRWKNAQQKLYEKALVAEQRLEELESEREQKTKRNNSVVITDKIRKIIESSGMDADVKQKYLKELTCLDTGELEQTFDSLPELTPMDMKYIVCFSIGMDVQDISAIFNIEPASVYTVRYRIKKKSKESTRLDFLV